MYVHPNYNESRFIDDTAFLELLTAEEWSSPNTTVYYMRNYYV